MICVFDHQAVLRAHSAETVPSPVSVRTGPSVTQCVESAAARQGSAETCAKTVSCGHTILFHAV